MVLRYAPRRIRCRGCGLRLEGLPWADPSQWITRALSRALAELSRKLSWKETAIHFGVDWKTIASAVRRAVAWGLKHRPWGPLRAIGIDQVSRSKGERCLALAYDRDRRRLVWIGENRDIATMEKFVQWLGSRRGRAIRTVCCDMWSIYIDSVRKNLPQATLAFDRFHVVQHLSRAIDEVRRQTWRQMTSEEKAVFKRTRWIWLKNPWNLQPQERRRLSQLCRKNQAIVRAYYRKEAFQCSWDCLGEGWARPYLKHWLWWASHSRLEPFRALPRMVQNHLDGILS